MNMKVLVTGGTGLIGTALIAHFVQKGWQVRSVDLTPQETISGVVPFQCDVLDFPALCDIMQGCDMVVHLAALRAPSLANGTRLIEINTLGTYNVFEAAALTGIKRVVQASSINALGAYFSLGDMHLQYLPVDEDHPSYTTDPYSFSKQIVEEIGQYYWRREHITSTALRFPAVYTDGTTSHLKIQEKLRRMYTLLDSLAALSPHACEARLAEVKKRVLNYRQQRPLEYRVNKEPIQKPAKADDLLFEMVMVNRYDLWSMVDVRDVIQAIDRSLTANYEGSHPLFISGSSNVLGYNTQRLIKLFYPDVPLFKSALMDSAPLISIEKAHNIIGYNPQYSLFNISTDGQGTK